MLLTISKKDLTMAVHVSGHTLLSMQYESIICG